MTDSKQFTYFVDSEYIQKAVRGENFSPNGKENGYYFLDKGDNVYSWLSDKEMLSYEMIEIALVNPQEVENEVEEEDSFNSCGCQCEEDCAARQSTNTVQDKSINMIELTDLHIQILISIHEGKIDQPPHFYSENTRLAINNLMSANLCYVDESIKQLSLTKVGKKILSSALLNTL